MPELYSNSYRDNLDNDDDIKALEIAEGRRPAEEPKDEVDELPEMKQQPENAEEETFKKRYGDARRQMQKLSEKVKELERQLKDTTSQNVGLPTSEEEIENWYKQYPDVAKIFETIAIKKAKEMTSGLDEKFKMLEERERLTAKEKAEFELRKKHPDFDQIRADPAFHKWAESQPLWVQRALYENDDDADSCARAIDLFKMDTGRITQEKPKKKPDASEGVKPSGRSEPASDGRGGKKIWKESEIARMNRYDWDKYEEDITLARRENRIEYDLSRGSM